MSNDARNIVVLGSTGSVGTNTLDVISQSGGRLRPWAISAHSRLGDAIQQVEQHQIRHLALTDPAVAEKLGPGALPDGTQVHVGAEALDELVARSEVDTVVSAIVGIAGLRSTWAALAAGKRVALANKETLVVAGKLVHDLVTQTEAELIPIDSEHSAIYQALSAGRREDVARLILTSSGGPFHGYSSAQLANVTLEQALAHPTWDMGPRITIDSATMMNKALEIVEARWLFDIPSDQIDVVVHPQSVVHSMVEFVDGSVVAQMSPPDMRLPIQLALSLPERWPCHAAKMDFSQISRLDFIPPDTECFPAIDLGHEVAARGGTAGVVMNAAKESAVGRFMDGQLEFHEIVPICQQLVSEHPYNAEPNMEQLLQLDHWARQEVSKKVCT